jgi:hypothetical protein
MPHAAVADDAGDDQALAASGEGLPHAGGALDDGLDAEAGTAPEAARGSGAAHAQRVSGRGSGVGANRGTSRGWVSASGSLPPPGAAACWSASWVIAQWSSVLGRCGDPDPVP